MRLLHVVPSFYPAHAYGGPITSLHRLACAQVQRGLQVRVLTTDAGLPGTSGRWIEDHGVPTLYARSLRRASRLRLDDLSPELLVRLPGLLRWADLLHVTAVFSPSSVLALLLAAPLDRPVVLSPRGSLLPWALSRGRRRKQQALGVLRPLLRRVRGWHVTSQEEAQGLTDLHCLGPRAIVAFIENGVDLQDLPDLQDAAPRRPPEDGPAIAMLGRIDPVKGLDLAVAALSDLRREHPQAALVLAGPDRDGHGAEIRDQAERLGLGPAVRFPGLVIGPEKEALLRDSDVLWLCSRMESFGNVVIEALAAGTPVVAVHTTPWGWLEQAGVGRWVPAEPRAVAAATMELWGVLRDPAAGPALRRRCREAVAARFSWQEIAARMSAFYDGLLSPSGPGTGGW